MASPSCAMRLFNSLQEKARTFQSKLFDQSISSQLEFSRKSIKIGEKVSTRFSECLAPKSSRGAETALSVGLRSQIKQELLCDADEGTEPIQFFIKFHSQRHQSLAKPYPGNLNTNFPVLVIVLFLIVQDCLMCGFLTCYEVQLSSLNTKRFLAHPRKNFHQMRCPLQNIIRTRNQPRKKLHNTFTNIYTEQLDELEISIACYLTKTKPLSTITHRNREGVIYLFQYKSTGH